MAYVEAQHGPPRENGPAQSAETRPARRSEAAGAWSSRVSRFWPMAVLAALSTAYYLPLLASPRDHLVATPDIESYFQWLHQYARDELLAGRIPLWNPYIYAGTPYAANPQCSLFYPLSWWYLFLPPIHAHK